MGCPKIEEINFDVNSKVKSIPEYFFADCVSLEIVTIPNAVITLGRESFRQTNIKTFRLSSGVVTIDQHCFHNCKNLTTFIIPRTTALENIEIGVFSGCSSLNEIISESSDYFIENSALYNGNRTRLIAFPPAAPNIFFTIPQSVQNISQCAFLGCHTVQEILIPDNSVSQISTRAFENCTSLKRINIPQCVKQIGPYAFSGCTHISCGTNVQNQTAEYIDMLVNVAKLSRNSLKSCMCTLANKCSRNRLRMIYGAALIFGRSMK